MKKRIIICCDGTWNDLEMRYITNVGRVAQALLPEGRDGIPQLIYYDDGVGADSNGWRRMLDGGVGIGLERNIYEAYRFLCFNYNDGDSEEERDEVCLFGFSRGAYTVRSLAGMLGRVGLARRETLKHIPEALSAYREGRREAQNDFITRCSRVIPVDLLACWDTVGALGIPDKVPFLPFDNLIRKKYEFHDTDLGAHVRCALHAVAIDERRKEFDVTCMEQPEEAPATQILKQVWFPGDHGAVGGGSWEKRGLSNAALRWVLEEASRQVAIGYDLARLRDKAAVDASIFFDPSIDFIYGKRDRALRCTWNELHPSVFLRWKEHSEYRPRRLKAQFGTELDSAEVEGVRKAPGSPVTLAPGEGADLRVQALRKRNKSRIRLLRNARYRIRISDLQVWKDGDLDPCGIHGWRLNTEHDALAPWKAGRRHEFNSLQAATLKAAAKKRVVPDAAWFELVWAIGKGDFQRFSFEASEASGARAAHAQFTAPIDGELVLAANDLPSNWPLIDKYDNNQGWVWIRIERES